MKNNPKLIYHNKHLHNENKRKLETITISYCPKYDYIRPRLLSGPCWKNTKGRKEKKINIDKRNYYTTHLDFLKNSKCLVNMNKTTQRGEFINETDIRLRNEKSFEGKKRNKRNKNKKINKYKSISLFVNISNNNKNKKPQTLRNKNNDSQMIKSKEIFSKTYNNFNIHLKTKKNILEEENKILLKNDKNNTSNFNNSTNKNIDKKINNTKINAPDFNKFLSREQIDKIKEDKLYKIPFIIPNYTLVRERPLVMAIYKKNINIKKTI